MKRPLILVCGGGHCKSVIEAAESAGFAIKGILDVAERIGDDVLGYKSWAQTTMLPYMPRNATLW